MIVSIEGQEETRGQVSESERANRFGHPAAVLAVDDHEAAQMLERELFDRGAAVVVAESPSPEALALATAAGLLVIVPGAVPPGAIDLQRLALEDAVRLLEKRDILSRGASQFFIGEGI